MEKRIYLKDHRITPLKESTHYACVDWGRSIDHIPHVPGVSLTRSIPAIPGIKHFNNISYNPQNSDIQREIPPFAWRYPPSGGTSLKMILVLLERGFVFQKNNFLGVQCV